MEKKTTQKKVLKNYRKKYNITYILVQGSQLKKVTPRFTSLLFTSEKIAWTGRFC